MGLVIQVMASVGNQVIFVLTRFQLNAIGGLLEQIDGGGGIDGKCLGPDGGCEPRIQFVKGKYDIDRSRRDARQELVDAGETAAEKFARKGEVFA